MRNTGYRVTRVDRVVKEIPGVQLGVAMKVPEGTMDFIGPGAQHRADHTAGAASVLGRVGVGEDRKLPDGFHPQVGPENGPGAHAALVIDGNSIQLEEIGKGPTAGDTQAQSAARLRGGALYLTPHLHGSRLQSRQLQVIPTVEGQLANLHLIDQ